MLLAIFLPIFSFASTIDFDDLNPSEAGDLVSNSYNGLNWNNFYVLNNGGQYSSPGYVNGIVSSSNIVFNGFGDPAGFSSSTAFTFNSIYLTAAWNDGLTVDITGYLNGNQVDFASLIVDTTGPTLATLDWSNIDSVVFSSHGGTPATSIFGGTHFAADNLKINETVASVPEPLTLGLFSIGLLGIGAIRRRRQ